MSLSGSAGVCVGDEPVDCFIWGTGPGADPGHNKRYLCWRYSAAGGSSGWAHPNEEC